VIVFDAEALDDLERIFELNADRDPAIALDHIEKVRSAVLILDTHPEIGRPAGRGSTLRELVISHGKTGYIALYEHSAAKQLIRVVAVRHQREVGYRGR
jgi:addiction module RelE/StbE family toxin